MAERQMDMEMEPVAFVISPPVKDAALAGIRASLPKWDDKNYKGLVYRP